MIPYVAWTVIPLGPLRIQVWGLFVAAGIAAAAWVGAREARAWGLDRERLLDAAMHAIIGGLVGARLGHALLYEPRFYAADPLAILRIWEGGMSMLGAWVGGAVALWWYAARTSLDVWAYANLMAFTLPLGCGIGRLGCFFIHDHPGTLRNGGFLTVRYPDGDRYDHGLLLSIVGFVMFAVFLVIRRLSVSSATMPADRQGQADSQRSGTSEVVFRAFLPLFLILDGTARFALDFLRATDLPGSDIRYVGLTPAQYGGMLFIALGAGMLYTERLWKHEKPPESGVR